MAAAPAAAFGGGEAQMTDVGDREVALRDLENAATRFHLLAESSEAFQSARGVRELIDIVARRFSEVVGEGCTLGLVTRDGQTLDEKLTAIYHPDPAVRAISQELMARHPLVVGKGVTGAVLETGEPVLLREVSPERARAATPAQYQPLLEKLSISSLLAVALRARKRVIGVIVLTRSDRSGPYTLDDQYLAQDVADRAALAIENALLVGELEERVALRTADLEDANQALRALQGELESLVEARTREKEAAEAANRELETFSYSVAHDLRTPLRAIHGFSSALLDDYGDTLDAGAKALLRRVNASAERMGHIIDALLSLARLSTFELRHETVDLAPVARAIVEQLRATEPGRSVQFVVPDSVWAHGDPGLLRAVLENLLGNAWKFTRNQADARIELGAAPSPEGMRYFVRDNGAGFDMAFADRLFAPFQRLHSPEQFDGDGVGLATVQRIVRRHGGRVWAEGKEQEGATFQFTLAADGPRTNGPSSLGRS
jgi:signal transduction histidine kinase